MKSFTEVAQDFAAIKEERTHARIVLPNAAQVDDNRAFLASLLEGTEIEQAELAGLSLEVGASAITAIAAVDGGISPEELFAVVGSLWVDGVVLGVRYMAELYGSENGSRDAEATGESEGTDTP